MKGLLDMSFTVLLLIVVAYVIYSGKNIENTRDDNTSLCLATTGTSSIVEYTDMSLPDKWITVNITDPDTNGVREIIVLDVGHDE